MRWIAAASHEIVMALIAAAKPSDIVQRLI